MNIDREKVTSLYDIYKDLLTDKEKEYFEYYFCEDYSLNEISEINEVSKSYSSKYLNQIVNKLLKYESSLKIYERNNKIKKYLESIDSKEIKDKIEELL